MTAATYTSDLSDIFLFESTSGVTAYGGGPSGLGAGVDFAMEGTNAVDKQVTVSEKGLMYDNVSNFTIGADDHFFIWIMGATPGIIDSRNNRGIVVAIGDSTTAFVKFHVNGNDTLPLGGGQIYSVRFVNTTLTNLRTLVGTPGTTPSWIGGGLNVSGTSKSPNLGVDGARIGTGYDILNGTGADPEANFAGIASDDEGTSEGVFQTQPGGYTLQGKLRIGSSTTECEFLDSNALVTMKDTIHSLTDFTEILIEHASSIVTLNVITFLGLGTNNPGRFEMITSTATVDLTNCTFQSFGVTILGTGATCLGCSWIGCDIVTANGANLSDSSISAFEGTADTSSLIWDTATDPDGLLDDMSFTKGTAATHAIEFGLNSPITMTLRGIDFSGYNAADTNNDSTFHVKRTVGTVTINIVGGSGNTSYKSEGATVVIVQNPVTLQLHVTDLGTGDDISGARVLVEADDLGPLPFEDSVTITRVTTTASVVHTAHGLSNGELVNIKGADDEEYNGVKTISNVSTNGYDYTVAGTPDTPATGTITSTSVIISNTTNASGLVTSVARAYSSNQPFIGRIRQSSSSPFYKTSVATGTIDKDNDTSLAVQMVRDE